MGSTWLLRIWIGLTAPRVRDERGDVPGWVMITLMTGGLVALIWSTAEGRLTAMLGAAFDSVH
ncbi:MAG: hypothetical protein QM714_19160 [Nocardioides sp.]|uniref:hypothetical protein n=1 Tax=Nocardioides sp. TaxID=35761 RepID=UPI0039E47D74